MWSLQSPRETAGKLSAGLMASGAARRRRRKGRRAGAFFGADALAEAGKEKLRGGGRTVYFVQTEADVLLEEVRGGDRRSGVGFTAPWPHFTSLTHTVPNRLTKGTVRPK